MKITSFDPGGLDVVSLGLFSTGYVSTSSNSYSSAVASNTLAVAGVLVTGAAASNFHLLASSPMAAAWVPDAPVAAPTTADYLVGTAQTGLSAEIVVGATPGGELGGTWASPTVDATHSGSTHAHDHWHGAWSDATAYAPGDMVSLDGASWVCVIANTALMPLPPDMREAMVGTVPVSYWRVGEAAASTVSGISVANPTHITTSAAHGLVNGATVVISGSTGGTPTINGTRVVTVVDSTHFTIPVNVTVAGSGGTVNVLYAVDEMGAHNGTYVNSPTLGVAGALVGDPNTAMTLSGSPWVNVLSASPAGPISVAVWLKTAGGGAAGRPMGAYTSPNFGWMLEPSGAGFRLMALTAAGASAGATSVVGSNTDGLWHLYVGVLTTGVVSLSVDGGASVTAATSGWNASQLTLQIGLLVSYFNGTIDEPAVYDRAITPSEIAGLHAVGTGTVVWERITPPAAYVDPTTATAASIATALIAAGLMAAS